MNDDWLARWQVGKTGWHETDGNASLKRYWRLSERRVLVPLCGKAADLLWLEEQGNTVVGVELSELAIVAFFEENNLPFTRPTEARFDATGRNLTLVCGDYFQFSWGWRFDALYDRGSLVALPAELRGRYAAHTRSLLRDDAFLFVITVDYDQRQVDGPPFSISDEELLGYWPQLERIDRYDDLDNCPPKFIDAGLSSFYEAVWQSRLTKASP